MMETSVNFGKAAEVETKQRPFKTDFIDEAIKKTPYSESAPQFFLERWFEVNDSIEPVFVSREDYQNRGNQVVLEKNDEDKQSILIPKDLQLYEIVDFIKVIDDDTYAKDPKLKEVRADKIMTLGKTFEKAGIYLNSYLSEIDQGKKMANKISQEFYNYGISLQERKRVKNKSIPIVQLLEADKRQVDQWLLGNEVYQNQMAHLGDNPTAEVVEEKRKKMVKAYFAGLNKYQILKEKTKEGINRAIEIPQTELIMSVFNRGMENLKENMKEPSYKRKEVWEKLYKKLTGSDLAAEKMDLYNSSKLLKLEQELDKLKEKGEITAISQKELQIAKKIHSILSGFHYKSLANNPSEMIKNQLVNCLGAVMLGGGLLDKFGINYLAADLPDHAVTVLITSNGKAYWQDFMNHSLKANYQEITSNMLEKKVDIASIVNKTEGSVPIKFKEFNPYKHVKGKLKVNLSKPESGLSVMFLGNLGAAYLNLDKWEEAIEAYQQAIRMDSNHGHLYNGLGNAYLNLGKHEEAIEAFQQAIRVDPDYAYAYNNLGNAYYSLGKYEEAVEAYQQALKVDSDSAYTYDNLGNVYYSLGKYEEAIEAYEKFVSLSAKVDEYSINRAKKQIEKSKYKLKTDSI